MGSWHDAHASAKPYGACCSGTLICSCSITVHIRSSLQRRTRQMLMMTLNFIAA